MADKLVMPRGEMFCGIIDNEGVESFQPLCPEHINMLVLRARFNTHRNAKVYVVGLKPTELKKIESLTQAKKWKEAARALKKIKGFNFVNDGTI